MRIAIFDYLVVPNNAIGNCDRNMISGLADEHEFTVFAVTFDNPRPDKIKFVRIPALRKPLFMLFITYHLLSPIIFFLYKLRTGTKFDVVQGIESKSLFVNVAYAHFCHRAYLRDHWNETNPEGSRGVARWLNHTLHKLLEPVVYNRVKNIVVPSQGLARGLSSVYGQKLMQKITVISNPVNVEKMKRPADYDRAVMRAELGFAPDDLVLVFVALGHFERKGLPILLQAMSKVADARVKLLVVGGTESMIKDYQGRANALNIGEQVKFVGLQKDVRPYLWAADIFAFPSLYEIFPLVSLESAAAGLPLLTSPLYGVEELLVQDENGWFVPRTPEAFAEKLQYALDHPDVLTQMGAKAAESAKQYSVENFVENWRKFYASL